MFNHPGFLSNAKSVLTPSGPRMRYIRLHPLEILSTCPPSPERINYGIKLLLYVHADHIP